MSETISHPISFDLIAAVDEKLGIGKNGVLPWKLKKEMAFFTAMTKTTSKPDKRNAVLMGRNTWESIPDEFRPLPGRLNVVLSRTAEKSTDDVLFFLDLESALKYLANNHSSIDRIWNIGGARVYKESMEHQGCNKIYLTEIEGDFGCDVFFPEIPSNFTKLEDHGDEAGAVPIGEQEENNIKYHFRIYQKRA